MRVEHDANDAHTTIFIDDWCEVRDGKLVRFIVHGGQRIVRLAEGNGAPSTSTKSSSLAKAEDEPPAAPTNKHVPTPVAASSFFLSFALLAAITARYRRTLLRVLPLAAPIALLWALGTSVVGCKGPGEEEPPQPQEGTVLVLGEADELLFADAKQRPAPVLRRLRRRASRSGSRDTTRRTRRGSSRTRHAIKASVSIRWARAPTRRSSASSRASIPSSCTTRPG